MNKHIPEVTIILPCKNEEESLDFCLKEAKKVIKKYNLDAEILVSDSSNDKSANIAKYHKVKLVKHNKDGYGNAYLEGIKVAKGRYIVMIDADGTYDFNDIPEFINLLKKKKVDFVIGNRFKGNMQKGAMSFSHKYIGNPLLSGLLKLFFKTKISDSHCGLRAIKKEALLKLKLNTKGMEFASEMVIKAIKNNLKIVEIPTNYFKRIGKSKLKSFSDGWRHLRFMLLYCPLYLFFIPGVVFLILGIILGLFMFKKNPTFFGVPIYYHPLFLVSLMIIVGYQLVIFSLFSKTYAINHLGDKPIFEKIYKYISIEKASLFAFLIILLGLYLFISLFLKWKINFASFTYQDTKKIILGLTLIVIGIQTIFSSFMLSILGIKE